MMSLPYTTPVKQNSQNKTSQIYAEKNKDHITTYKIT
jgi:hypothetical protein